MLTVDGNDLKLPTGTNKGNFVSMVDGFSDFLKGGKRSVKPLTLEFSTLDGGQFSLTYDTMPSLAIMDDEFNLYFIEEEGIEYDSDEI